MKLNNNYYNTNPKKQITAFSWNAYSNETFTSEEVLFYMDVVAKQDGKISELLSINSSWIKNETYRNPSLDVGKVELDFIVENASLFTVSQNKPNPWAESTRIEFTIPEKGDVDITVWNLNGEKVYYQSQYFEEGANTYTIHKDDLKNNGLYLLELKFQEDAERQRILLLE